MRARALFFAIAAAFLLAACAHRSEVRPAATATTALPPRVAESSLPAEEIEAIPEPGAPGSPVAAGAEAPARSPAQTAAERPSIAASGEVEGYRVQLYASPDRVSAETVAAKARSLVKDVVYVEEQPPLFKVRTGDYLTRDDAEKARDRAREAGYPDAWIVEARVHRHGGGSR